MATPAATSSTRPTALGKKLARRTDRFAQFALAASDEALEAGRLGPKASAGPTTPSESAA